MIEKHEIGERNYGNCVPNCGICCIGYISMSQERAEKLFEESDKKMEELFVLDEKEEEISGRMYLNVDDSESCILLDEYNQCQAHDYTRPEICEDEYCATSVMIENLKEENWAVDEDLKELCYERVGKDREEWLSFAEDVVERVHRTLIGEEETKKIKETRPAL